MSEAVPRKTDYRKCDKADGIALVTFEGFEVHTNEGIAKICLNKWASSQTGFQFMLALDFAKHTSTSKPAASEIGEIVAKIFPELFTALEDEADQDS